MITNKTDRVQFFDAVGFAVGGGRATNDFNPYAPTTSGEVNRVDVDKDARSAPFPPTGQILSHLDHEGYDDDDGYNYSNIQIR
eukprot:114976-Ditylum_brightwellii.AAC.1